MTINVEYETYTGTSYSDDDSDEAEYLHEEFIVNDRGVLIHNEMHPS